MLQLLIIAAIGIGAFFGYRWLKKQVRETALAAAREAAEKKQTTPPDRAREAGDLIWDEKEGVYRTKD